MLHKPLFFETGTSHSKPYILVPLRCPPLAQFSSSLGFADLFLLFFAPKSHESAALFEGSSHFPSRPLMWPYAGHPLCLIGEGSNTLKPAWWIAEKIGFLSFLLFPVYICPHIFVLSLYPDIICLVCVHKREDIGISRGKFNFLFSLYCKIETKQCWIVNMLLCSCGIAFRKP